MHAHGAPIDDEVLLVVADQSLPRAVYRVVLEHVLHVVRRDEGVVDGGHVEQRVALRRAQHEAADAAEAVDADADRAGCGGSAVGVDDVRELGLERGAADKETIDVRLRRQHLGVGCRDGATIDDAGRGGDCRRDVVVQPVAQLGVHLLCLLGGCNLARADRPDRLVRNDKLRPVGANGGSVRRELLRHNIERLAGVALLQRLAECCDDSDARIKRRLGLGRDDGVRLPLLTALGVPDDGVLDANVLEYGCGRLACVGASRGERVLRSVEVRKHDSE